MNVESELPFNTDLNPREAEVLDAYRLGYEHGKRDYMAADPVFETWEELEKHIIGLGDLT